MPVGFDSPRAPRRRGAAEGGGGERGRALRGRACPLRGLAGGERPRLLAGVGRGFGRAAPLLRRGAFGRPGDPQFAEIEKAWDALKPTVAFYEGPNRPVAGSAEETIRQAGESGFVRFLAKRDGVTFLTLEPSPQEEAAFVSKKYPAEQVMLFYVLRETARLRERRKLPEAELKAAVAGLLEKASKMTGLAAFTTLEGLEAAYRRHWTAPANWWEAPQQWFDPLKSSQETGGLFTNDINRLSSEYRNLHMYTALAYAALEGKRVFAVVGRNHVPMQAQALRCAVK